MADCPKCGDQLLNPRSCGGCGWRSRLRPDAKEVAPPEHIPCAHETCGLSARVRVKTPTGWAKLCEPHYVMHFDEIARKRCVELGLDRGANETRKDHRKRLVAYMKSKLKPKTFADAMTEEERWAQETTTA